MKTLISAIAGCATMLLIACNDPGDKARSDGKMILKNDSMTYSVKNISTSINRPAAEVYEFASDPENFPKWVEFVTAISRDHERDYWIAKTNLGDIRIRFAPLNDHGVIDHEVWLASGEKVYNPMRVIANNEGCEFIFTLFWMPGRTEEEFNKDASAVANDLQNLKELMESK